MFLAYPLRPPSKEPAPRLGWPLFLSQAFVSRFAEKAIRENLGRLWETKGS